MHRHLLSVMKQRNRGVKTEEMRGFLGVGEYFAWEKRITSTRNLNLNFGANPKNPDLSVGASASIITITHTNEQKKFT